MNDKSNALQLGGGAVAEFFPWTPLTWQLSLCTGVSTVSRRHSWQSTANRQHLTLVAVTYDLPALASSSFHGRRQVMETAVLLFMVPSSWITCHTICGQPTYRWPPSERDWKHFCLKLTRSSAFAASFDNLGYISGINNNNNNIIIDSSNTVLTDTPRSLLLSMSQRLMMLVIYNMALLRSCQIALSDGQLFGASYSQ